MEPDLERILRHRRDRLPQPDASATEDALRSVIAVMRARAKRRPRSVVAVALVTIALSAASFAVGRWTRETSPNIGAPSAAAFLPLASGRSSVQPIAVRCNVEAVLVKWDAGRRVQVLEYAQSQSAGRPMPTGRILAYADAAARTVNPACATTRASVPRPRTYDSAPFASAMRVDRFCAGYGFGFVIQIRPVLDRAKRTIGNRLLVQDAGEPRAAPLIDARVAGKRSHLTVRVQRCVKPFWQS